MHADISATLIVARERPEQGWNPDVWDSGALLYQLNYRAKKFIIIIIVIIKLFIDYWLLQEI